MMSVIFPPSTNAVTPLGGHQIKQFALSEATLAVTNHFPVLHTPQHIFQEDLLHYLARHWGDTDLVSYCSLPRSSFFIFFKNVSYVPPFSITGNFTSLSEAISPLTFTNLLVWPNGTITFSRYCWFISKRTWSLCPV